jgi:hypothetical protein
MHRQPARPAADCPSQTRSPFVIAPTCVRCYRGRLMISQAEQESPSSQARKRCSCLIPVTFCTMVISVRAKDPDAIS